MEDDLKRGLISKKGLAFQKMFEECLVKIQRIKQKNDLLQKKIGSDMQDSIQQEINNQREYLQKEIEELKGLMQQIENKYRDPESKNKLKQLKTDAQKQIERNKIILKDVINRSFVGRSGGKTNPEGQDPQKYMEGGTVDYTNLNGNKVSGPKKSSLITEEQIEIDYDLERKIMLEKNEMINQVEQSTNRINELMNDMGAMVEEQGENLNVISDELMKANTNMTAANDNIEQANTLQRSARKKYIILVALLLLIIIAVAGIIFIVTQ